jgi:hypothetical protein
LLQISNRYKTFFIKPNIGVRLTETDALKQELEKLQNEMAAFQTQCTLFEEFISMARSPDKPEFTWLLERSLLRIAVDRSR